MLVRPSEGYLFKNGVEGIMSGMSDSCFDILELEDCIYQVDVSKLAALWNPFSAWRELDGTSITRSEVEESINSKSYSLALTEMLLSSEGMTSGELFLARKRHIDKIAYFVVEGFSEPIDVEFFGDGSVAVNDGNHRLCATIIRGDRYILSLTGGFVDCAIESGLVIDTVL